MVFAFLFLVGLYESWSIPIPVLLSVVVGVLGWHGRVERPLARTRRTLKEDVQWAKEEMA